MKWAVYIFSLLWRLWFFVVFSLIFLLFIPSLFFFTAIIKNQRYICIQTKYWSKLSLFFSGIIIKAEWEEALSNKEKYIICPNHTSTLDIPLVLSVMPISLMYMGKSELAKIPFFGYFYRKNTILVNRLKIKDTYAAFIKAKEKINQGLNVCIFPEGGIPNKKIFLKKFKNGAFRLAIENDIKIIPVSIADNKFLFPKEYYKGYPGIARIKIHKPISKNILKEKTPDELNNITYNIIFEQLKKYEGR